MRRWQLLFAAGLVGVGSLLLVPMELLVSSPMPPATLRLLALVNPAFLLVLAVGVGEATARRVGLGAPVIDAWLSGKDARTVLRRQLLPALIVGVVVAMIVVIYGMTIGRNLIAIAGPQSRLASFDLPLVPKLLYGGITEEIITRWGLVSLIAWIGWRLKGRPATLPGGVLVIAVTTAALLFGAGHLPLLFLIAPHATAGLVVAVLAANAVPGIMFGVLYVRQGLEAAMIAHATAHLISAIAIASFHG